MTLAVDRDGTATGYSTQDIATLNNVSGLIVNNLLTNGHLLV
jgi:DNA-binding CsgD family transcriptional regulator